MLKYNLTEYCIIHQNIVKYNTVENCVIYDNLVKYDMVEYSMETFNITIKMLSLIEIEYSLSYLTIIIIIINDE